MEGCGRLGDSVRSADVEGPHTGSGGGEGGNETTNRNPTGLHMGRHCIAHRTGGIGGGGPSPGGKGSGGAGMLWPGDSFAKLFKFVSSARWFIKFVGTGGLRRLDGSSGVHFQWEHISHKVHVGTEQNLA